MALMERVSALVRANLNDLIDKAEDPEKMIRQVIVDMENQLIQVKTQVAIAVADEHLLAKKKKDNEVKIAEWTRKAEMAVDRHDDALARAALERGDRCRQIAHALEEQVADQKSQVESLRGAYRKLEDKLAEARTRCEVMIAEERRSRTARKAAEAGRAMQSDRNSVAFDRMRERVHHGQAAGGASAEIVADTVDDQLDLLERDDRIDRLLAELKARRA